jgi:hypothetical protein
MLLTGAEFSGPDALHIYRTVPGSVHGHVLNELQEPVGKPGETIRHRPEPGSKIVFLASGRIRADEPVVLLDVLHSERFADLAPAEVCAIPEFPARFPSIQAARATARTSSPGTTTSTVPSASSHQLKPRLSHHRRSISPSTGSTADRSLGGLTHEYYVAA